MAEPPQTSVTLLNRLKNSRDVDAWREFFRLYGPVVYSFARNRGLQDADAADLMQEVLRSVARNADKMDYDPSRGTFRGWLYTVTRNKIYNFLTANKNRPKGSGDPETWERINAVADSDQGIDATWELEYQRQLAAKAMERVKLEFQKATWDAFWGTAVEGRPANEVGAALKMTAGAVYVAKSRILARLREEVKKLEATAESW